jgi:hypothetical protein
MKKILSSLSISSMSSSDSYQSLVDLDKPNAIECPICLEECNDDDKTCKKEKNKVFTCKHAVCRDCYNRLKQQKPYKCPVCRKEYGKSSMDPVMVHALSFTLSGLSV